MREHFQNYEDLEKGVQKMLKRLQAMKYLTQCYPVRLIEFFINPIRTTPTSVSIAEQPQPILF